MTRLLSVGVSLVALSIISAFLIGCESSVTGSGSTGSLNVKWLFNPAITTSTKTDAGEIDPDAGKDIAFAWPEGVSRIKITVDAEDMSAVTVTVTDLNSYDTYIYNVPAGSSRTVTVEGYDSRDRLVYAGLQPGVTVVADYTTQVTVALYIQVPVWREYPSPTANDLDAIDMISASDGWICGRNGTVLNYDGTSWKVVNPGITNALYDVSFADSNNGWIVGPAGVSLRYKNGSFEYYEVPGKPALYSVYTISSSNAWAVGEYGVIYHFDGSIWYKVNSPTEGPTHDGDLNNITFDSRGVGWACGNSGNIVKYAGGSWTVDTTVSGGWLISIKFPSDRVGWTVGGNGRIFRYESGSGWNSVASPTAKDFRGVSMCSTLYGTAAGVEGLLAEYDEESDSWILMTCPVGEIFLNDIECVSEEESWAIGDAGTILHYSID